jgi:GNAT superfamily N-acetyltransferase
MNYTISTRREDMQLDKVHALLAASYWSPRIRREIVEKAMAASLVAGAFDGCGNQVGYARVVTDHATFAWLCDVIVEQEHRGQGLSRRMLEALHATPSLGDIRRWCLATRDAHGLYEKLGYQPVKPGAWMELKGPVSAWQEPPASV